MNSPYPFACVIGDGSVTKIVCTQPRRISAISVAERVASERGESFPNGTRNKQTTNGSVGFQIRLSSVIPRFVGGRGIQVIAIAFKYQTI